MTQRMGWPVPHHPNPPPVAAEEFVARQKKAAAAAAARGFDALLACARGGGTVDRYANVYYLANFYSSFPFITDRRPDWSARAHSFLLVPAQDAPLLIADMAVNREEVPVADVIVGDDVLKSLAGAIRERGLSRARIGIAGSDVLPHSVFRVLERELPEVRWEEADDILIEQRMVKSPAEIAILRRASEIGSHAIEQMMEAARPGATHGEIMGVGLQAIAREGGILYNNFMSSGRGGNQASVVASDFPTWAATEPLEEGQWFQIGLSGVWRGYYFDHSRSKPIGPAVPGQIEAFEAAIACVEAGIAAVRPGVTAGSVAEAALSKLAELDFSPESDFSGLGHGIGMGWDAPWLVPGDKTLLVPGMVLCIERTVHKHGYVGDFEETVLVTPSGSERLSKARIRQW
jgi:Xaa-Pro aminopeptidase